MRVIPILCSCGISGFESPALEYQELGLSLDDLLIRNPNCSFLGKAVGDSMNNALIFDGDILIVDRSLPVRDGSVIIANLNGEFVCKILDKTNGLLLSASSDHPPVKISESDVFQLEGKVTFNIRKSDDNLPLPSPF
jgi:DNA polymerase V